MVCMAGRLVPSVCYGDGQTTNADTIPRTIPLLTNENSSAIVRIVCPSSSSVSISIIFLRTVCPSSSSVYRFL